MLKPGAMSDPGDPLWPDNPIGIGVLDPLYDVARGRLDRSSCSSSLIASAASSVVRFRRSRGDERQQLKWMTYGVARLDRLRSRSRRCSRGDLADVLFALTIAVLPVATAIAMFKYRLYEIDRVISRTIVYGALTVILGAAYAGLVLAGQAVFSSFAGGSNLAIAGSTLVVAALFLPLRGARAAVRRPALLPPPLRRAAHARGVRRAPARARSTSTR